MYGVRASLVMLALGLAGGGPAAAEERAVDAGEAVTALENARVVPVSGPPIERGTVLLRGRRIEAVGTSVEVPAGARRVDLGGRILCPGFVDAASRLGLRGDDRDRPAGTPEAAVADAVDLRDGMFAEARRGGVTSLLISPGSGRGTFAGRTCLVKPRASGGDGAVVAERDGPVKVVLGDRGEVASLDRAGAAAAVRERFRRAALAGEAVRKYGTDMAEFLEKAAAYVAAGDAPEETLLPPRVLDRLRRLDPEAREASRRELRRRLGLKDPSKAPEVPRRPREPRPSDADLLLQACARGEVEVRFEAHAVEDLRAAAALAKEFHLRGSVEGGAELAFAPEALREASLPVAVWAFHPPWGAKGQEPAAALVPASARGCIAVPASGDVGGGAVRHLRLGAAAAAGRGMDVAAALRSVTLDAARAAGFEARIGSLQPGKDADLLVLDGEPLALGTRIVGVWIDGVEQSVAEAPR